MTNIFQKVVYRPWEDTHVDETAIFIGHGKSLNDVPKELLNKYPSFGCNYIYKLPFQPTYYICVDTDVLRNYSKGISATVAQAEIAFLNDDFIGENLETLRELYKLNNVYLYNRHTIRFPEEFWFTGGTAAYVALKIAYVMGFSTIILVGCDRDKEWAHFTDDYPGGSKLGSYLRAQEFHLRIAGRIYKKVGRHIVNLSLPSVLDEYFERGRLDDYT